MEIKQHDPVIVSQAPANLHSWGPWQFPAIQRLPDNRLAVGYHVEADSATAYGKPAGMSISSDEGRTWQSPAPNDIPISANAIIFTLPNGDLLRQVPLRSVDPVTVQDKLPASIGKIFGGYRNEIVAFNATEMPSDLAGYRFARLPAGSNTWQEEHATVTLPGAIRSIYMGVLTFPWMHRISQAPNGSLWGIIYVKRFLNNKISPYYEAVFLHSTDHGHTWHCRSTIPYHPTPSADSFAQNRDGFTEPNLAFLPDGTLLCLLRTTDANGIGPLYIAHSTDDGLTWSTPTPFDDCGVWPALVTLKNGVTLSTYGRPGLYLRATNDPSGKNWDNRIAVVEPTEYQKDTCSYSDLLAISDHEALLAYSNFNCPDANGKPCKTILVRKISIE
jgi:hypothetical protein